MTGQTLWVNQCGRMVGVNDVTMMTMMIMMMMMMVIRGTTQPDACSNVERQHVHITTES